MTNKKLLYITTNKGKFEEVYDYLHIHLPHIELIHHPLDIEEIQSNDQKAITLDKAQKAWNATKQAFLLDDAGIYFKKYHDFPGTMSKFIFQGLKFDGLKKLIDHGDPAKFLLHLAYCSSTGIINIFPGECQGTLIKPTLFDGIESLPYDAFFIPEGATMTYAQMRINFAQYKNYFYRIRALQAFLAWQDQYGSI